MANTQSEEDFRNRIRERYEHLPRQQQLVAGYLVDHIQEVPFLSIPELADRSGASEATVVRFAKRVGYTGFSDLKVALLEALRERVVSGKPTPELPQRSNELESLQAVARQETQNIQRTLEELDRDALRDVATAMFNSDHVYVFGLGISSHFADLLGYLLAQIGLRATTLSTRHSSPLEQLLPLRSTDLLVIFSMPPYSKPSLDMLRHCRERGIPTLAITDKVTAPAANLADRALTVRTDNLLFTNAFGAVATLLNALITEIAVRHQDHAFDALTKINRILAQDRAVIAD